MGWFLFAASGVALFTALDLLQRKMSIAVKFPRAMSVVFNLWAAGLTLILFLLVGGYKNLSFPRDPKDWLIMLFALAMYAMFERNRFLASKLLEASVFAITSNVGLAVAFIGSIFIYGETLTPAKIVGVALIILSLIMVSIGDHIKKVSMKGIFVAVSIYFFLGLGWMLDKWGALTFTPNTYTVLGWIIPLVFIYFPYVKPAELKYEAKRSGWKIVLLAVINVLGYFLQLKALTMGEAIVVIPVVQTFMLFTVLLGIVLLGERDHIGRKLTAAAIGFAGALLLIIA